MKLELIVTNIWTKHHEFRKTNWEEADQLAINITSTTQELNKGLLRNNLSYVVRAGLELVTSEFQVQLPEPLCHTALMHNCGNLYSLPGLC